MTDGASGTLHQEKFIVKWKVERFFANCEKIGKSYKSPIFSVPVADKSTKWYLKVYPRGLTFLNTNDTSMFIHFISEHTIEVNVNFKLSIVSENDNLIAQKERTCAFKSPQSDTGWSAFVAQTYLKDPKNGALINDTFRLLCEIKFDPPSQEDTEIYNYDEWINAIGYGFKDYEKLFESGRFSDVTFNVQGKQISAHKAVLSCRSPVFEAMFEHEMRENKENSVDITDIDYDVMRELIRFLYSKNVNNIEQVASQLIIAADKYQVIELKALCEQTLYDNITADNVIDYLKLTEICDTIHLKKLAIKFAAIHGKNVVKKPEFEDLSSNLMYAIIQAIMK